MRKKHGAGAPPGGAAAPLAPALQARWRAMARREQTLVLAAGGVVALALLWWVALAPALQTLRTAPARHAALDAQLQHMQSLQAEALQLQAVPRARGSDALRSLQTSLTQQLGASAQLTAAGDRVTVTLKGTPADALAQWLTQVRSTSRAVPLEARLTRSATATAAPAAPGAPRAGTAAGAGLPGAAPASAAGPASPSGPPRWDGTLVLVLPPT
ncbi:type II secretion system protein GspM [Acidovorax sp. Leaf160]|uniref:type II secretion system protein GspM n=1 Tax=Acidovorax sp. Leaf160 TaxID=1736280 RepID=UPI0006FE7EC6|nr:type II secretion system protein GspM [Acidovorax sp. Leaf160]KQR63361.1 general secretion pathway protein GspM [Acidovorax sp. Leaf160]